MAKPEAFWKFLDELGPIKSTDQLFEESPEPGTPGFLCSRCGEIIEQEEIGIRCWCGRGEYRFHMGCLS